MLFLRHALNSEAVRSYIILALAVVARVALGYIVADPKTRSVIWDYQVRTEEVYFNYVYRMPASSQLKCELCKVQIGDFFKTCTRSLCYWSWVVDENSSELEQEIFWSLSLPEASPYKPELLICPLAVTMSANKSESIFSADKIIPRWNLDVRFLLGPLSPLNTD